MPNDFQFVLSCRNFGLPDIFEKAEQVLFDRGFWRSREVIVSTGEQEVDREELLLIDSIVRDKESLRLWTSIYMEFSCSAFRGLGVQFDRQASGYSNGFLSLNRETMLRIHRQTVPIDLYSAIAAFADTADCNGGFGDFNVSLVPVTPDHMLADVLADPLNRDLWHSIFVLPKARLINPPIPPAWASQFERLEEGRVSFFLNHEFLDFCRQPR